MNVPSSNLKQFEEALIKLERQITLSKDAMLLMFQEEVKHELQDNILGRLSPLPGSMSQVGVFSTWQPLAESTIDRKASHGLGRDGNPNSMLWSTGALAESIESTVEIPHTKATVGTDIEYAAALEFGTSRMPPRPFMGPAASRAMSRLYPRFERILTRTIAGQRPF